MSDSRALPKSLILLGALFAALPAAEPAAALRAATSPPSPVLDINPRQRDEAETRDMGIAGPLVPAGKGIFFAGNAPGTGTELWVSDGSVEGTALVRDGCPGECSSRLLFLGGLPGGRMVLRTEEAVFGREALTEVWVSDGTRAGSVRLTTSADEGPKPCGAGDSSLAIGPLVYFTGEQGFSCHLWVSDGTAAGTRLVGDASVPFEPRSFAALGGKLYFFAGGPGSHALWRSDGTGPGTVEVWSFAGPAGFEPPRLLTAADTRLFFVVPGDRDSLWVSDGTAAGTKAVFESASQRALAWTFLKAFGTAVYFSAEEARTGAELWISDGTPSGTKRLTTFANEQPFERGSPVPLAKAGNRLVFVASDAGFGQPRLWSTAGTPQTTVPLTGCPAGCPRLPAEPALITLGNRVLLRGGDPGYGIELWSTDGTAAGTRLVRDLCPGFCDSFPGAFAVAQGKVFFLAAAVEDAPGPGLWMSDGTAEGTAFLAQLRGGFDDSLLADGAALNLAALGEKVYFPAQAGSYRRQLWESDGTAEGTGAVTLFGNTGAGSDPELLTRFGAGLLFRACNGSTRGLWRSDGTAPGTTPLATTAEDDCGGTGDLSGLRAVGGVAFFLRSAYPDARLWRTDGTDAGTYPLPPFGLVRVGETADLGGRLVFVAVAEAGGAAFWESDGTIPGTRHLLDLPPPIVEATTLAPFGSQLYFIANPGPSDGVPQLWATDGSAAGTRQLTSFTTIHPFPSPYDVSFSRPTPAGDKLYFVACPDFPCELWKSDGTAAGTGPALPESFAESAQGPADMVEFQGALHFTARVGSDGPRGLFRTDGTPAGTLLLRTLGPQDPFEPASMTPAGGSLFFAADDGEHGRELWRTDGTSGGTILVRDIAAGPASSRPTSLLADGGRLLFTASDGDHGFELWQSDGTAQGTHMLVDLSPGGLSSSPAHLTRAGDGVFFSADDGIQGRELWRLPLEEAPSSCEPSETALCLGGGRFRVEAAWRDFAGNSGTGRAKALTADTGYFWFFDPANVEVVLKTLDGRGVNGHWWVFYGALSSVEYTLTVTDMETGAARRYVNPPGRLGSVGDVLAFGPLGATGSGLSFGPEPELSAASTAVATRTEAAAPCVAGAARLCLSGGRFAVEARWRDFSGGSGTGTAVPLSGDTGYFWFFGPENVEVVLKVLDGRPVTGKFWVFYGALSSVEYTLTVTDTETGAVKTYTNPSGRLASRADTGAF